MFTPDFQDISKYIQDKINDITANLQASDDITKNTYKDGVIIDEAFKFVYFTDKGDYHKRIVEPLTAKDRSRPDILVLISSNGGLQDTTVSIPVYLQKVKIEVYAWDDDSEPSKNFREDLTKILNEFCYTNKQVLTTIAGTSVKLEVADFPTYGQTLENKHFVSMINVNMNFMFTAILSNSDKIYINSVNQDVPYVAFTEDLDVELVSDNKKNLIAGFIPNYGTYQVNFTGLYDSSNDFIKTLLDNVSNPSIYTSSYAFKVGRVKEDGSILFVTEQEMLIKHLQVIRNFGSVIGFKLVLYPKSTVQEA